MANLDLRPGLLNIDVYRGNPHTVVFDFGAALGARTFQFRLDPYGTPADIATTVDGNTVTAVVPEANIATLAKLAWELVETTGGTDLGLIAGRLTVAISGGVPQTTAVTVTTSTGTVTVQSPGASVGLSGDQTIAGVKTWTGAQRFKGHPWHDVTAYGAVGDGVTDDTTAIQAASAAAEVSGGTVFFPVGAFVYDGGGQLLVDDARWWGAGKRATSVQLKAAGDQIAFGTLATNTGPNDPSGNMTINGNTVAEFPVLVGTGARKTFIDLVATSGAKDSFTIMGTQNSVFFGCHGRNAGRDNLVIDGGAKNLDFFGLTNTGGAGRWNLRIDMTAENPAETSTDFCQYINFFATGPWEDSTATWAQDGGPGIGGSVLVNAGDNIHFWGVNCHAGTGVPNTVKLDRVLHPVDGTLVGTAIPITTADDLFTLTAHGLSNGDIVRVLNPTAGAANLLIPGIGYYVVSATANTFQLSATSGGAAINFATDGTADVWKNNNRLTTRVYWHGGDPNHSSTGTVFEVLGRVTPVGRAHLVLCDGATITGSSATFFKADDFATIVLDPTVRVGTFGTFFTALGSLAQDDIITLPHEAKAIFKRAVQLDDDLSVAGLISGSDAVTVKTVDEIVNNSVGLQNDDHLTFAVGANQTWAFEMDVYYTCPSDTADLKAAVVGTSTVTGKWTGDGNASGSTSATSNIRHEANAFGASQNFGTLAAGTELALRIRGVAEGGASGGNVTLQWAQQTAELVDLTVKRLSRLRRRRIT